MAKLKFDPKAIPLGPRCIPAWCTKPKPCDFDPPSDYCVHRECMEARKAQESDTS